MFWFLSHKHYFHSVIINKHFDNYDIFIKDFNQQIKKLTYIT
jgi:hypothetical protein